MYQLYFKRQPAIRFSRFSRKGYALFACLGREVLVGVLSVATLANAKAEGIGAKTELATDSLTRRELKLDEVVVTGSRAPLTALQSAKMVTVISRDEIRRAAATSIQDILKLAQGVDVRQRGPMGVQTDISINGGTFDQITILLNGMDIGSPQTGHNAADFPVALEDIERIEVLEGAAARVFGSSAFSGAINIVTRREAQNSLGLSSEGGSYGTIAAGGFLNLATGKVRQRMSGGYGQSDGGTENTYFRMRRTFYQGDFSGRRFDLFWQAGITSKDYGAGTFYGLKSDNQYEATRRLIASVGGRLRGLPASLVVEPMLYGHRDWDHYQWIKGKTGAAAGENFHRTDVYGASLNMHLVWALGRTALGGDLRRERIWSTAYGEPLSPENWCGIHGSNRQYERLGERTNTSLFLEHDVVLRRWTLSMGLLANGNSWLGGGLRFYPGIDLAFRPATGWKLFASWNKALRLPTYTDLYISNRAQMGDLHLRPERVSTFRLGANLRQTGWEARTGVFYSRGRDMVDWVFETSASTRYHALNIGRLDNMGASVDVKWLPREWWPLCPIASVRLGYAYIHQRHDTSQPIFRSLYALEYLRHQLTAEVDHHLFSRLSAHWALRWQRRMNGYHPYAKIDGKLLWTARRFSLFLQADNLTAHRYYDLGGVRQPGLWIMAGGNVRF